MTSAESMLHTLLLQVLLLLVSYLLCDVVVLVGSSVLPLLEQLLIVLSMTNFLSRVLLIQFFRKKTESYSTTTFETATCGLYGR